MKAMILAAGFGTRLKPITDKMPKALVEYRGGPMILYQIERLRSAGIDEIVVNAHHFSEQILDYFSKNRFGIDGCVLIEDEILGTGGGILNAREFLAGDGSFLVINVDVETDMDLGQMIIYHDEKKPLATIAVQKRKTSRYLEFDEGMRLKGRATDNSAQKDLYAFNGIHVISDEFFRLGLKEGFSDIIELYLKTIADGSHFVAGYDAGESLFRDLGKKENLV